MSTPKPPVRPPVRPPTTPPVRPPVTPPRPGPIRANDTGRVPPSERNTATRGGTPVTTAVRPPQYMPRPSTPEMPTGRRPTMEEMNPGPGSNFPRMTVPEPIPQSKLGNRGGIPVTVIDAPGYRGIGTPTMPSSLPLGAKKGGVVTTRKISTATKSKKQSSW